MSEDLEDRVARLEEAVGVETDPGESEWTNPWGWSYDHRAVNIDMNGSGFDFGVDEDGDIVIHRNGYCRCVTSTSLLQVIEQAEEVEADA